MPRVAREFCGGYNDNPFVSEPRWIRVPRYWGKGISVPPQTHWVIRVPNAEDWIRGEGCHPLTGIPPGRYLRYLVTTRVLHCIIPTFDAMTCDGFSLRVSLSGQYAVKTPANIIDIDAPLKTLALRVHSYIITMVSKRSAQSLVDPSPDQYWGVEQVVKAIVDRLAPTLNHWGLALVDLCVIDWQIDPRLSTHQAYVVNQVARMKSAQKRAEVDRFEQDENLRAQNRQLKQNSKEQKAQESLRECEHKREMVKLELLCRSQENRVRIAACGAMANAMLGNVRMQAMRGSQSLLSPAAGDSAGALAAIHQMMFSGNNGGTSGDASVKQGTPSHRSTGASHGQLAKSKDGDAAGD